LISVEIPGTRPPGVHSRSVQVINVRESYDAGSPGVPLTVTGFSVAK
jgi:hypothetical protein